MGTLVVEGCVEMTLQGTVDKIVCDRNAKIERYCFVRKDSILDVKLDKEVLCSNMLLLFVMFFFIVNGLDDQIW